MEQEEEEEARGEGRTRRDKELKQEEEKKEEEKRGGEEEEDKKRQRAEAGEEEQERRMPRGYRTKKGLTEGAEKNRPSRETGRGGPEGGEEVEQEKAGGREKKRRRRRKRGGGQGKNHTNSRSRCKGTPLSDRPARRAASLMRLARSAPVKPVVLAAMLSTVTSSPRGNPCFWIWVCKISCLPIHSNTKRIQDLWFLDVGLQNLLPAYACAISQQIRGPVSGWVCKISCLPTHRDKATSGPLMLHVGLQNLLPAYTCIHTAHLASLLLDLGLQLALSCLPTQPTTQHIWAWMHCSLP